MNGSTKCDFLVEQLRFMHSRELISFWQNKELHAATLTRKSIWSTGRVCPSVRTNEWIFVKDHHKSTLPSVYTLLNVSLVNSDQRIHVCTTQQLTVLLSAPGTADQFIHRSVYLPSYCGLLSLRSSGIERVDKHMLCSSGATHVVLACSKVRLRRDGSVVNSRGCSSCCCWCCCSGFRELVSCGFRRRYDRQRALAGQPDTGPSVDLRRRLPRANQPHQIKIAAKIPDWVPRGNSACRPKPQVEFCWQFYRHFSIFFFISVKRVRCECRSTKTMWCQ